MKYEINKDYTVTNAIVRWVSNGRIPFTDVLTELRAAGKISVADFAKSNSTREKEQLAFLAEYIEANKNREYSDEECFEMRAAFGKGVRVVNIFTGKVSIT